MERKYGVGSGCDEVAGRVVFCGFRGFVERACFLVLIISRCVKV